MEETTTHQETQSVTVIECSELKKWNDKQIYKVVLSDKKTGESFQQIPLGTPLEQLKIETTQYGNRIKWSKPGGGGGGKGGRPAENKNESFALSYSKDIVVAMVNHMPPEKQPTSAELAHVAIGVAEKLYEWLEIKRKSHGTA